MTEETLILTDSEKSQRIIRVGFIATILIIIAAYLTWNGDVRESGKSLGGYLAVIIIACLAYYNSWKPKRTEPTQ
jgi:hypothetical protein